MAATSELDRVAMVVLRSMRRPVFALVLAYAIGITGMALIPGQGIDGNPEYMSLFHAFYFFTYTATTTGFGEIPSAFTDEQRLWAIVCLYMGVVAWLYALGSIIRLVQNPHFIQALNEYRFAHVVKRITNPFFIICGFGDTGSLLARGLSDHHLGAVVIDKDPERIKALALRDYRVTMPGLYGDPSVPKHLVDAGVQHASCKAVVILTSNEDVNLKIAVMARFMNPTVQIVCRSTSPRHQEHLRTLNNVVVIDPFEIFAQLLSMAITAPRLHNLNSWLVRAHGVRLGNTVKVPTGDWILCGYGRMGHWLHQYMARHGIHPVIIDPDVGEVADAKQIIRTHADHTTLKEVGIEHAAGIVAGTDHDSDNLSILMSCQTLNPSAFVIVRQNDHENQLVFDAARAALILQSSLTTARRILKTLISPQIQEVIQYLREQGEQKTGEVAQRLQAAVGAQIPHLWGIHLCRAEACATADFFDAERNLSLGDLIRDPHDPNTSLDCVPLAIQRDSSPIMLPGNDEPVCQGDEILLCGTERSEKLLNATLNNPHTLHYLVTGTEAPRGYFFKWFAHRRHNNDTWETSKLTP